MEKGWLFMRVLYFVILAVMVVLAMSVTTWAFKRASAPLLRQRLATRMAIRAAQATPGVIEYYWVQEHGALHLKE